METAVARLIPRYHSAADRSDYPVASQTKRPSRPRLPLSLDYLFFLKALQKSGFEVTDFPIPISPIEPHHSSLAERGAGVFLSRYRAGHTENRFTIISSSTRPPIWKHYSRTKKHWDFS